MNKIAVVLMAALVAAVTVPAPVFADPPGGRHGGGQRMERETDLGSVIISAAERALIGEYYRSHSVPVDSLPPGIRKKVVRGKPLPPGIAKRFPSGLRAQLPGHPGYDYRAVGADVLLVEVATGVIVDVVRDILR